MSEVPLYHLVQSPVARVFIEPLIQRNLVYRWFHSALLALKMLALNVFALHLYGVELLGFKYSGLQYFGFNDF